MGFFRTILLIVIIYYLIKIVMRYLLPVIFGSYMNRKMNDFSNQFNKQQQTHNTRKEGEVIVDDNSYSKGKKRKDRGEYIEYEEIND